MDVAYVLVGRRDRLSEPDADLLDAWRAASPSARVAAMTALTGAAPAAAGSAPRTMFQNATIGQQISGDADLRAQKIIVRAPKGSKKATR